ncbi:hypothetical protein AGR7A_Lc130026 [Agrobacterium deltaense NCPPB 1641]|uniref:Uncharacterized protein n=1 Tax=Agrobacterium deltaense NCPPB 1641 TaxID=1183425 RepID=A0A1S7U1R0_9HYPH|nr:hypothetical protein AGR7A_Lc130026 [Agrobacterium deltaense NCPPB 1641]
MLLKQMSRPCFSGGDRSDRRRDGVARRKTVLKPLFQFFLQNRAIPGGAGARQPVRPLLLRRSESGKLRRRIRTMARSERGQLHHHRARPLDGLGIVDPFKTVGEANRDLLAVVADELDGDNPVIAFYIGRRKLHDMPSGLESTGTNPMLENG